MHLSIRKIRVRIVLIFYVIKITAHQHFVVILCFFICRHESEDVTLTRRTYLIDFAAKVDAKTGNCGKIMM